MNMKIRCDTMNFLLLQSTSRNVQQVRRKNTHFSADAVLIQHQLSEKANKYTRLHKHVKISGYSINMLWWNHLLHQSKPTNYILCSFYRTLLRSDINVSACTRRKSINCPYKFFSYCIYFQSRSSHICKCN